MVDCHEIKKDERTAIVLVTGGTTREGAMEIVENCEKAFQGAFPDAVISTAIASGLIRQIIREGGKSCEGTIGALGRLIDGGFSKIILQPLYVTPGNGLHALYSVVETFNRFAGAHSATGIKGVLVGKPLLMGLQDYRDTADALMAYFDLAADETLVLVSSADEAGADPSLCQLQLVLDEKAKGNIVIGSSAGYPDPDWVKTRLGHISAKKVILAPMDLIPGKHCEYDISGSDDSWKSKLEAAGYDVSVSDKVLAGSEEVAGLFIASLEQTGKSHAFL